MAWCSALRYVAAMRTAHWVFVLLLLGCGDDSSAGQSGNGGSSAGGLGGAAGSGGNTAGSGGVTAGSGGDMGGSGGNTAGSAGNVGGSAGNIGGSGGGTGGSAGSGGTPPEHGHVAYRSSDGPVFLVEATSGAQPFSLTDALDSVSPGNDKDVNLSPDGQWLSVITSRFGCDDWECIVVIDVGLSQGTVVETSSGDRAHPESAAAVSSGGDMVVFAVAGDHERDLHVMRRSGGAWTAPLNITHASPFDYNTQPAIRDDGEAVVFDCSPVPYSAEGTQICEVGIDGGGFRVVVDPSNSPNGQSGSRVHSADYGPDGSIVFEGEWGTEQIWRLPAGSSTPVLIGSYTNDNTPCVLPDGRVASLWLNAPGNPNGYHELKVMRADGSDYIMLVQGLDLMDTTVGCGL